MAAAGASSGRIAVRNATEKSLAFSKSLTQTAPRVVSLHRDLLRSVPWIKRAYTVPMTEPIMRSLITESFRAKRGESDVNNVNRLITMGRMELEETLMLWKGASHVNNWFEAAAAAQAEKAEKPKGFLENFYENR